MKLQNTLPSRTFLTLAISFASVRAGSSDGLSQAYCSTQNTGASYVAVTNIYNSNGSCRDQCKGSYAFAIMQYQQCWCSNYIPSSQVDVSECNADCPGFPDDKCGNINEGLFGYLATGNQASGTAGASSSTTTSTTPQSSSTAQTSTTPTSTSTPDQSPSETSSDTSTTSSYTPFTVAVAPVPITSATPTTEIQVITVSGAIVTQYVTSTPMAASGDTNSQKPIQRKSSIDGGTIAGIVIGVLVGLALIAAAVFFLWRHKKRTGDAEKTGAAAATTGTSHSPKRNVSNLSKSGLLARARPGTAEDDDPWTANTGVNSTRHSMLFGAGAEVSPVSPLGSTHDGDSRRHSRPYVFDHRLNPSALFANHEANGSRVSMQDAEDYTRPLGVRNPDPLPRASFSSR